ncbi:unnamed protein product [Arctogadus glacialis]
MDSLRQKLENQGLVNVSYMVINHQGIQAQGLHSMLTTRLSSSISLYKQGDQDADVWQALKGEKDDFLIYDRCGRLTYHIALPYSIIGQGHVENAIKDTYCKRICGDCSHESVDVPAECTRPVVARPDAAGVDTAVREEGVAHGDGHGRGHHGQGHHHGDQQVVAHAGHDHGHRHHHGGQQPDPQVLRVEYEHRRKLCSDDQSSKVPSAFNTGAKRSADTSKYCPEKEWKHLLGDGRGGS